MAKPVKDASSVMNINVKFKRSGREEAGQIQTSWRGAGQTELAVQTGALLSFRTLRGKRKDEKQHSEKESVRETFHPVFTVQVSSPETATRIMGFTGWALPTHTAPLRNPPLSRGAGFPLRRVSPFRSSFKERVSGLLTVLRNLKKKKKKVQHRTPQNTLQGRRFADGQKQREEREVLMGMLTPWLNEPWGSPSLPQRLQTPLWWQWEGDIKIPTILNQLVYAADVLHQTFESMPGWRSCRRNQLLTNVREKHLQTRDDLGSKKLWCKKTQLRT